MACTLTGHLAWVSDPVPGRTHDARASPNPASSTTATCSRAMIQPDTLSSGTSRTKDTPEQG
ncbi:hypothetical protein [Propionibacterium australiense]|uniref:Uncharacterized protein n=1 Tax=Propionibacterium australiense TaxID=119981 RepID=A0A8B3FRU3_9ACTN|nr:hypothetical protein D7U36_08595 [Propionibacterium australiense]